MRRRSSGLVPFRVRDLSTFALASAASIMLSIATLSSASAHLYRLPNTVERSVTAHCDDHVGRIEQTSTREVDTVLDVFAVSFDGEFNREVSEQLNRSVRERASLSAHPSSIEEFCSPDRTPFFVLRFNGPVGLPRSGITIDKQGLVDHYRDSKSEK